MSDYLKLKALTLKSAQDFLTLYQAIPEHEGSIVECRERGFALLERQPDFLDNRIYIGSYDEEWSLRKVLRRFIWHDRIHAKTMYRMAVKTFGADAVPNVFFMNNDSMVVLTA